MQATAGMVPDSPTLGRDSELKRRRPTISQIPIAALALSRAAKFCVS